MTSVNTPRGGNNLVAGIDSSHPQFLPDENVDCERQYQWNSTGVKSSSPQQSSRAKQAISSRIRTGNNRRPIGPSTSFSEKDDFISPIIPTSSSSPSFSPVRSRSMDPSDFDQQEKVRVRLVENQGLVVEEPDLTLAQDLIAEESSASHDLIQPSFISPVPTVNCLKNGKRTSCPGHSSRISSYSRGCSAPTLSKYYDENECECGGDKRQGASHSKKPFSIPKNGSISAGFSSLTPLMNGVEHVKDNHKIEVVMKPSSRKHQQGGSNIHLYCALVLGFSSSLFFSLTLLLAKVLKNRDHHPISITFWRYLGILLPSVPLLIFYIFRGKRSKVVGSIWPIQDIEKATNVLALLMRGVLGATAVILRLCSLKYLSIGDSSVISYCAPAFAAIIAPCCVKREKGVLVPLLVGIIAAFGIFLLCRPPILGGGDDGGFDANTLKGVFLASLSTLCASGVLIIVRNLLQKIHFSLMMFVLGSWGVFEAGVLALSLNVLQVPVLLPDIVMMFGVSFLTFFGQLFVLLAMQMGQVGSAVSAIRSCDIFLSFLWQFLFLKTEPESFSLLSGALIILVVWFICFRKWLMSLRENHVMRQKLSILLY